GVGATVATVLFSDNVGVTAFTFTATGTQLSADGFYQISNAGVITLTAAGAAGAANDFETGANSFVHNVTAADAAGNTDTADITLSLTNLNDNAPRIDDAVAAPLNENSANGTAVYDVNEFFTGNDTDIDGQALNYSIIGGNTGGAFTIDAATGLISVANTAALDFETTPVFNLTIQASDGALADTAIVTVNLNDINEPPVNSVPGTQSVTQDTPLVFNGANAISVNDPEGMIGSVQLTVLNGTLNVALQGGATISAGAIGTGTLTISGSQADINATLATLVYQGNLNYSGADSLTIMSMNMPAPGNDTDTVPITVTAAAGSPGGGTTAASGPVGLNMPDLGWPSGQSPFAASSPAANSWRAADQLEVQYRDFVLPAVNESLRLRTLQAAQLMGAFTAADMGEIEAVSFGDGLQVEPALFVLPAVQEIRGEFDATAERAREFGTRPAPGTAPLLNDFDAYSRFLSQDGTQRDTPAPAQPTDPRAASSAGDAPAAPDAAPAAAPAPGASSAPASAEPAGAPAFSAQLRTAAALRTQVDAQLLASLRALRKS
ncbi:MAG TPA: cadherin domain-containing protein, partial [Burkholderiales bacterium]|nr:cadherin domain-containing protein [Burkholderiales bacterium]